MGKILKIINHEIKGIDEKENTVEVVVSTETKDADGDILLKTCFSKHIARYKANPVLLNSHNYRDVENVIGKAISIKATDNGLVAKFKYFIGQGNSAADWAFQLAKNGIAAFSVGFDSKKAEFIREKRGDGLEIVTGRKFIEVELLEISQVTVPSNRDAVLQSRNHKSAELKLLNKINEAFESKKIEQQEDVEIEQKKQAEQKNITSIWEEILFGQDSGIKEIPKSKKPQNNNISSDDVIDVKINSSEIERLTKETLK